MVASENLLLHVEKTANRARLLSLPPARQADAQPAWDPAPGDGTQEPPVSTDLSLISRLRHVVARQNRAMFLLSDSASCAIFRAGLRGRFASWDDSLVPGWCVLKLSGPFETL